MIELVESVSMIIFLILFALLLFIFKLARNENNEIIRLKSRESRQMAAVSSVKLPFSLEVDIKKSSNNNDKISFLIHGIDEKATIILYCYVGIDEIHKLFVVSHPSYKTGNNKTLQDALDLLSGYTFQPVNLPVPEVLPVNIQFDLKELPVNITKGIEHITSFSTDQVFAPFVVHVILDNQDKLINNNDIEALAFVVYKNNGNQYEVKEQFIQTVDQRVFPLKTVFDAGIKNRMETTEPTAPQLESSDEICVICHHYPVTRVILPCRHACVCKICFMKVNTCPVCRLNITSYFQIKSEESFPMSEEEISSQVSGEINEMGLWSFVKSIWNAS